MVSRHHASIVVLPGGDCHVRDENSRNGTYVNGEKLGTTPRLLKDGDKISIAYFDLQFLDRAKTHADPHPLRKLGILLAVALVLAGGWFAWEYLVPRPTAEDYRKIATRVAAEEDFARALSYMDSADRARNASVEEAQNTALRGQIVRWRDTCDAWRRVNDLLGRMTFEEKVAMIIRRSQPRKMLSRLLPTVPLPYVLLNRNSNAGKKPCQKRVS